MADTAIQTQLHDLKITKPAAARALRHDHALLGLFVEAASPSDVASRAGMPANLVHHHVRRLVRLGLLFEQRREAGRVYYQLRALTFRIPSDLLPPEDPDGRGRADMEALTHGFCRAYEYYWRLASVGEEDVWAFGVAQPPVPSSAPVPQGHPVHLDSLTLRLTPERYARLARELSDVISRAYAEGNSASGACCTLAVVTYADEQRALGQLSLTRNLNTFLGLNPPLEAQGS